MLGGAVPEGRPGHLVHCERHFACRNNGDAEGQHGHHQLQGARGSHSWAGRRRGQQGQGGARAAVEGGRARQLRVNYTPE